ncbi:MAG: chromatin protein Cren7 [Minisyncoccia bacterium]
MRNKFKGKCENCGCEVAPKQGYWRLVPKQTRDFTGLRCKKCGVTYKSHIKEIEQRKLVVS